MDEIGQPKAWNKSDFTYLTVLPLVLVSLEAIPLTFGTDGHFGDLVSSEDQNVQQVKNV